METPSAFASLGLAENLLQSLAALGYEEPTPIQKAAIPPLLEGRDVLGQAATGTGKTAAFALPMLQRVRSEGFDKKPRALVLVPTRELAMQVAEAVHKYGRGARGGGEKPSERGTSVLAVYGGASMVLQVKALERGVTVVVATPGRAVDLVGRGALALDAVEVVVLDEADEMLDMGFAEDLDTLLGSVPKERQTALFSATMPPRIAAIASKHLRDPVRVSIARETVAAGTLPRVKQVAYVVARAFKSAALGRVLDMENPSSAIVFCRTRTEVDEVTEQLTGRGYRAEALHGGFSQEQRDRVMKRFRSSAIDLLVATDVAARGLDIEHVSHVVNYDVPSAPEAYVHRIGRTGRAGREGVAITLAEPREHRQLRQIESITRQKIQVTPIPTVADLRTRRLELLRSSLRETVLAGDLDHVRVVVESLASEFDVMDVAAAAVKLAQAATGEEAAREEQDIPQPRPPVERAPVKAFGKTAQPGTWPARAQEAKPFDQSAKGSAKGPAKGGRKPSWEVARIFIGAGREAGVRPADLVGAIANEARIDSKAIGAIEISLRYSLVEVPAEIANDVITALRATKIKGRKAVIKREHEGK